MTDDFDWYSEDCAEDIVVPPVDAIAVYTNKKDHIVIRQKGSDGDEDSFVILPKSFVSRLISALQSEISD